MSVQEQPVRYDIHEQKSSSSLVVHRGNEEYDPFANEDDESENEQLTDSRHQQQESIRATNGPTSRRVVILSHPSDSADKSSSVSTSEQQSSRRSKSPAEHHRKHSDRRSRSPHHRNHYPSDHKRLRTSSPDTSISNTVNHNDSVNSDVISSSTFRRTSRTDNRADTKYPPRQRSPSNGSSSRPPPTSSNNTSRKSTTSRDEKTLDASDSYSNRRFSKRDDYHSYRDDSSRIHQSYSSSKYPARDHSSSSHPSYNDRRTLSSKVSDVSRIPSTTTSDEHASRHQHELNHQQETPPNRTSPRTKAEATEPPSAPSTPVKVQSTNTNGSSKSIEPPKTNGNKADNMLMEEMLLDEEEGKKQGPVKSIDLHSLTIPDPSTTKTEINDAPVNTIAATTTVEPESSVAPSTTAAAAAATTTMTMTTTALTPSPTKKPYTLYKVPHTNHMTPPLSSRHKKPVQKESSSTSASDSIAVSCNTTTVSATNKPSIEEIALRTSLDERISTLLGAPPLPSNKPSNSSADQHLDTQTNLLLPTTTTPSDKSTESPQDVTILISATVKKGHEHSPLSKKLPLSEERRSTTSKHYTSEWLASQKPEEAPLEEFAAPPSLIVLPTLISSQSCNGSAGETNMLGKLSEAMSKLIQKKNDTNPSTTTDVAEEAVPISAKHLERIERRKQREKRQSEIAAIAKEALKPAFKRHDITKEEYKAIMKKVVTKATNANEVDRIRISRMIEDYVKKYRTLRERGASKISTVVNGNGS